MYISLINIFKCSFYVRKQKNFFLGKHNTRKWIHWFRETYRRESFTFSCCMCFMGSFAS